MTYKVTNGKLIVLITAFIVILVGISLLQITADDASTLDDTTYIANESVTAVNNTDVSLGNQFIETFHELRLGNGTVANTAEYNISDTTLGLIHISSNLVAENEGYTFYGNYTHYNSAIGMPGNGAGRTLINLNVLFFALGILFVAVVVGYWAYKEMNF